MGVKLILFTFIFSMNFLVYQMYLILMHLGIVVTYAVMPAFLISLAFESNKPFFDYEILFHNFYYEYVLPHVQLTFVLVMKAISIFIFRKSFLLK